VGGAPPEGGPPEPRGLERGEAVGRFVLIGLLGRGGMGEVYAAYDPELDRKVAVKILRARSTDGEARLLREAQAIAKLQHPNVVVVYDVGKFHDTVFIAMEFVDGHTLGYWMNAEARPWREVLRIFQAAGRGLEAAHTLGMIHRDFKPENVMLTKDGQIRVMDFGLARQMSDGDDEVVASSPAPEIPADRDLDSTVPIGKNAAVKPVSALSSGRYLSLKLTQTGAQIGTPAYMAPEQFAAKRSDARTDQFSFCVALYEALYGQRPFAGETVLALMTSVAGGEVRPAPDKARVPGWIRRVVLRGLATDPDARYPSMKALLAALEADPSARRRQIALALLGVAAVAGVAVAASRVGARKTALCEGGGARVAGLWEDAGASPARKEEIRAAFSRVGKSYAAGAFAGAARLLDDYVGRWTAMYRDACEATTVRGEQSADVLDLRMACLNERLGNLRALTDVFSKADDGVVQNAVSAAGALPRLDECADVAGLRAVVKPPRDPDMLRRVEALRVDLARATALRNSGQCRAAEAGAGPLATAAQATRYAPLVADTLMELGLLGEFCIDPARAAGLVKGAYAAAVAGHKNAVAVHAAAELCLLLGDRLGDAAAARDWAPIARASLESQAHDDFLEALVLDAEGIVLATEGDLAGRTAKQRAAAALTSKTLGPDHPFTLAGLMNIGDGLSGAGHYEEARVADLTALAAAERVYGPVHTVVAADANNLCEALNRLGRYDEARAACGRALAVWKEVGAAPVVRAYGLTGLGTALVGEGRAVEAIAPLEEAVAARAASTVGPTFLGESRFALARALWSRPATRPRALALARQARADDAGDAKAVAAIDAWLAKPR
jgi:eukaryotic-like serine/threonine-protein kinase